MLYPARVLSVRRPLPPHRMRRPSSRWSTSNSNRLNHFRTLSRRNGGKYDYFNFRTFRLLFSQLATTSLFSNSSALFYHSQNAISCFFSAFRTLCTETPGGGRYIFQAEGFQSSSAFRRLQFVLRSSRQPCLPSAKSKGATSNGASQSATTRSRQK